MFLRKLNVRNFKSFVDVTLHFNRDLNVLTGVNNSGKTTVLEALALWAECFRKQTWQVSKTDTKRHLRRGQYRLDYEHFIEIDSVRCPNFGDIFHDLDPKATITLDAVLSADDGSTFDVGFTVRYARGSNYIVDIVNRRTDFRALNDAFQSWPAPINVIYASPVAALLPREDFQTPPKVRALVGTQQSMRVLRNRLYQLKKDAARYDEFLSSVGFVLSDSKERVDFVFDADETRDVSLPVTVTVGPKDVSKDISLLGSGTLQIIEIMLALHAERRDLNIILLDEPDSHIHRDIQRRLVKKLVEHTGNTQVFLTTHNESLIRSTPPSQMFHLEARMQKEYYPIDSLPATGKRTGLQPSRQLRILQSLGSETSIDLLNALEAQRLVLVEGEDDARFVQAIVEQRTSPKTKFQAMYWSFGGIESFLGRITHYREVFEQIRNDKSLWAKAAVVLDRDSLNDQQRLEMFQGLSEELSIPVYVSTSYTMEATVLSDVPKLKLLVAALMKKEHGATPPQTTIDGAIDAALGPLSNELLKRVADPAYLKALYHRLRLRREQLKALGIKTKAFGDDSIQVDHQELTKGALANNQIHLLANKDDVVSILGAAYQSASIPFNALRLFERLIDAATPTTWFAEWSELADAMK